MTNKQSTKMVEWAETALANGDVETAAKSYRKAAEIAAVEDPRRAAFLYTLAAQYQDDATSKISSLEKAYYLAQKVKDHSAMSSALIAAAIEQLSIGNKEQAGESLLFAVAERLKLVIEQIENDQRDHNRSINFLSQELEECLSLIKMLKFDSKGKDE